MRCAFRQQAFRVAVGAVAATLFAGLTGCDKSDTPDGRAAKAILQGDYQAAAKEKGASPANRALAAKAAAETQYAESIDAYETLAQQQLAISQKLWQIGKLTTTAQGVAGSTKGLAKYKPDGVLAEIDKAATAVKGEGQQAWTVADDVTLPTATAAGAKANELKDKIAEIERAVGDLKQKHEQAVASARELQEKANNTQGEEGVNLFKQAVEGRKQASDLAIQLEQESAKLVPLQQELAVADAQAKQYAQTLDVFAQQRDAVERGWRGVSEQITLRNGYAGQVYAKADDAKFGSVALKAQELGQLTDDYAKKSQDYQQQLDQASALVRESVSESEKYLRDIPRDQLTGKTVTVGKLTQTTLDPTAGRLLQGQIQYASGAQLGGQAGLAAYQARVAEEVAQTGAALRQPVPESMNDAARSKLKTDQGELLTKAGETLKSATEVFDTAMQAPAAAPEVKRSATIGKMIAMSGSARVMQTAGDAATAKQTLDEAKALRDSLLETGPLPSLPDTLQGAAPPKPAAPVEQQ